MMAAGWMDGGDVLCAKRWSPLPSSGHTFNMIYMLGKIQDAMVLVVLFAYSSYLGTTILYHQ